MMHEGLAQPATSRARPIHRMFLERIKYNFANLLHSDDAVAMCQLDPEPLKNTVIELWNRGLTHLVLEDSRRLYWLVAPSLPVHQGNLIGDARRWSGEVGRSVYVKKSNEHWETPTKDSFVLPDGRVIEVCAIWARPQNFTCWALSMKKELPPNYIRI